MKLNLINPIEQSLAQIHHVSTVSLQLTADTIISNTKVSMTKGIYKDTSNSNCITSLRILLRRDISNQPLFLICINQQSQSNIPPPPRLA